MRLLIKSKLIFVYSGSMCGNRLPHLILAAAAIVVVAIFVCVLHIHFLILIGNRIFSPVLYFSSMIVCLHNTSLTQSIDICQNKPNNITFTYRSHYFRLYLPSRTAHSIYSAAQAHQHVYSNSMILTNHLYKHPFCRIDLISFPFFGFVCVIDRVGTK